MRSYSDEPKRHVLLGLQKRHWKIAVILGVSYLAVMWLSEHFIPHPATLFPASAIALSVLFLEGIELWPVVYLAALIGYLLLGAQPIFIIILPIAQALQAVVGATLLREAKLDPLFRRSRDIFILFVVLFAVSFIVPSLTSFANILNTLTAGTHNDIASWYSRFVGTFFCLLILTPFLLRWFAKPRFSRTVPEVLETAIVFAVLIGLDFILFIKEIPVFAGISLIYLLLIPLFWIALRLRPRFITLALLVTSLFALSSLYFGIKPPSPELFSAQLFQIEELVVVLASIFLIISSLEEDRRLNSNLMRTHMATLENAVARISSESDAKNSFIAILAHELRNPLAPVVSAIDYLKLNPDRSPEEMETLVMMEDRMHTVRRLLDDLLDISRITEGKVALKKERIELQTVIKRAIMSTTHHLKERHQALFFKAPEERLVVIGDPVRLEQVFSNLLTNASKYSNSGDQIIIHMKRKGEQVETQIADTGVGIEPEAIEKIFMPFHQVDLGARSRKGLGIGLALVRSFVDMHNGSVVATSNGQGKGSQFTVLLPLAEVSAVAKKPEERAGLPQEKSPAHKEAGSLHVLVVDDNDAAAAAMGRLLELKGCRVSYAYDGRHAIEDAANLAPDVILLDIGLPDMEGYAVAKTMRARGYRGRLIALTGFSTEDARERGRDAGFEHYLIKPAGLADLKRVIPEIA